MDAPAAVRRSFTVRTEPGLQVPFTEFVGSLPPQPELGTPGDVYRENNRWWVKQTTWEIHPESAIENPRVHSSRHPTYPNRVLELTNGRPSWLSIDTFRSRARYLRGENLRVTARPECLEQVDRPAPSNTHLNSTLPYLGPSTEIDQRPRKRQKSSFQGERMINKSYNLPDKLFSLTQKFMDRFTQFWLFLIRHNGQLRRK